jgi:DNA-binding NarL/FixJ family response regulator
MSPVIRLALVDDQSLFREGLRTLLAGWAPCRVALVATSTSDFFEQLAYSPIDLALVDVRMPGRSGLELVRQLRAEQPAVRCVLLTTFDERGLLAEALRAGAHGLLLKGASPDELFQALLLVARGGEWFAPLEATPVRASAARVAPASADQPLTERERSILRLVAGGYSNKEIARALGLVEGTVKNYISEVLLKLDARDRTQAVFKALAAGQL